MVKKIFFLICIISFLLYFPSTFNYFSHDDFFHLNIAKKENWESSGGFGHFRPLTTQAFYSISYLFNLSPIPLHVISFIVFFAVIFVVYKLINILVEEKEIALVGTFLYATSATHFGQLYYLGAFQELGLAFFFFSGTYFFVKFLKTNLLKYGFLTTLALIGALFSKETSVMFLLALGLITLYLNFNKKIKIIKNKILIFFIFNLLLLTAYLCFRIFYYGFASGDSYIFSFSARIFNTFLWYILWSFNLPELLVDYIGPALRINSNLFLFYGKFIVPILLAFGIMVIILIKNLKLNALMFFCLFWFFISLGPLLFLPLHKFSYELTVPLFGFVLAVSFILVKNSSTKILIIFLSIYFLTSVLTNVLTQQTHWITQGGKVAKKVFELKVNTKGTDTIVFYDTTGDNDLPWKPSQQLKQILSDNNFFKVFYLDKIRAVYASEKMNPEKLNGLKLRARDILYD